MRAAITERRLLFRLDYYTVGGSAMQVEQQSDGTVHLTTTGTSTSMIFWRPIPVALPVDTPIRLRAPFSPVSAVNEISVRLLNWQYIAANFTLATVTEGSVRSAAAAHTAAPALRLAGQPIGTVITIAPAIVEVLA